MGLALDLRWLLPSRPSIALSAFQNLGSEHDADWLGRALPEILSQQLLTGDQSGSGAAADAVLNGSFAIVGGTLRLQLSLVGIRDGGRIWNTAEESGALDDFVGIAVRCGRKLNLVGPAGLATVEPMRLYRLGLTKGRSGDLMGAVTTLRRAAALEPDNPLIVSALSNAVREIGHSQEARVLARRGFALSASVQLSPRERLEVETVYWTSTGDWGKAVDAARRLAALDPDDPEDALRLATIQFEAQQLSEAARTLEAIARLQHAEAPSGPPPYEPRALLLEARIHGAMGRFEQALQVARRSAAAAGARGLPLLQARSLLLDAGLQMNLGGLEGSAQPRARARQICEQLGDLTCQAVSWRLEGNLELGFGKLEEAEVCYRKALALTRMTGRESELLNLLRGLTWIGASRGDFAGAEAAAREAIRIEEQVAPTVSPSLLSVLAEVLRLQGDWRRAQRLEERALLLAGRAWDPESEAHAVLGLAQVFAMSGRVREADERFQQALGLFQKLKNPEKLARCEIAYAQFALSSQVGDARIAARMLDDAATQPHAPRELLTLARAQLAAAQSRWRDAAKLAEAAAASHSPRGAAPAGVAMEAALERAETCRVLGDTACEAAALSAAADLARTWREPRLLHRLEAANRKRLLARSPVEKSGQ